AHYNVILKDMEIDGEPVRLPLDLFGSGSGRGTIIDSGTTLAYIPASIYDQIVPKKGLKLYLVEEQFTCFHYTEKYDTYLRNFISLHLEILMKDFQLSSFTLKGFL
ncbi:aspartic proteinase-like protein 2-like, partial [Trifolium medium]|nr:aspartic proteinase-like protein 2-like [Trifolium medium]